jgi:hypothetical protein
VTARAASCRVAVRRCVLSQEGARNGPSLMPGGTREAYALMEPVITKIAAQVDGHACVTYIGELGSGNYVKMVHNGIEYGDMQLIAEAYEVLRKVWCFPPRVAVTALRPYLSILCDRRWECPAALCVCVCVCVRSTQRAATARRLAASTTTSCTQSSRSGTAETWRAS